MKNKRILHIAQYAAPYKGNFIASLENLEKHLQENDNNEMYYAFPENVKIQPWFSEFKAEKNGRVFLLPSPKTHLLFFYDKNLLILLRKLIEQIQPDIIHTHFDGYDVYAKLAAKNAKIIWHHHNPLTLMANPLKKIYQIIRLRQHYHRHGKNAYIVLLSDEFEKEIQYFGFTGHSIVIPNGIQIERVGFCPPPQKSRKYLHFYALAGGPIIKVLTYYYNLLRF